MPVERFTPSTPARPGSRRSGAQHRRHSLGGAAHPRLVCIAACAGLLATVSAAQAGWSDPLTVEHTVTAAAGNAQGAEAFMWRVTTPDKLRVGVSTLGGSYLQAQLRLPDGRLTSPRSISPTSDTAVRARGIALDANGTATAVWTQTTRAALGRVAIMVSARRAGIPPFRRAVEIGRAAFGDDVKLAVAADGAAMIVRSNGASITAFYRPAAPCVASPRGCFRPAQTIVDCRLRPREVSSGCGGPINVTFGPRNRVYLTWQDRLVVMHGRRFGPPLAIPTGPGDPFKLAVLPDGRAVLAWFTQDTRRLTLVKTAVSDPDGRRLSTPQTVSAPWLAGWDDCANLQLRANRQAETTLVWECLPTTRPAHRMIAAAVKPRGAAAFGAGTVLSPAASDATRAALAVDSGGNTILVYSYDGGILARVRRPRHGFDNPVLVGTGQPSQLLDAGDKVTVAWPGPRPNTTILSDWKP
jgi:hypothetical protein